MTASDTDDAPVLETGVRPRTASRGWWWAVLLSAVVGVTFTTVQIVEKIDILKHPGTTLICDVNARLSCTDVLNAWQSSVLGPPNALIGAIMFTVFLSGALAALLHSSHSAAYLATLWGLAVFFLCFASWFMYETAFSIGRLCIWCTGITTAVVVICMALTRVANAAGAFGTGGFGRAVGAVVHASMDVVGWVVWWLVIAALLWIGLH